MDALQIQQLGTEIAAKTAWNNWPYWLALTALTIIGTPGSFLGSYLRKRGEHAATKADLREVLRQLELTTRATETIKASVSISEWTERDRRTLRRVKLEEMLLTAHAAKDWMMGQRNRYLFLSDDP